MGIIADGSRAKVSFAGHLGLHCVNSFVVSILVLHVVREERATARLQR